MKQKYLILILLLIYFPVNLYSQYVITGKILDVQGEPIDFAEIDLLKDSVIIKREISDPTGYFSISNRETGTYSLQIGQVGLVMYDTTFVLNKNLDIGTIYTQATHNLEEVVVKERQPLLKQKADRIVFNVASDKYAQGENALQVLKRVPRVDVLFDNTIQMAGRGSVLVMLDGRLLNMSEDAMVSKLQSLRTEDIESIEVIPIPPAKYSAEGNVGMINIISKKNTNLGFQGTVNGSLKYNKRWGNSFGINTNYRAKKIELSLNANVNNVKGITDSKEDLDFEKELISHNGKYEFGFHTYTFSGSLNYSLTNAVKMGASVDYNISDFDSFNRGDSFYYNKVKNDNDSTIQSNNKSKIKPNNSISVTAYTDYNIDDKGKKLSVIYNYFNKKSDDNNDIQSIINNNSTRDMFTKGIYIDQDNRYRINTVFLDMELPTTFANVELGGNYADISNILNLNKWDQNESGILPNTETINLFEYGENRVSAYFTVNKQINSKWSSKIGLRYEHTSLDTYSSTFEKNNKKYQHLFPSLFLMYSMNDKNTLILSYSKRIERPGFKSLDPFRDYNNIYSYMSGNPSLQPSLSHSVEINYTCNGNLNITLFGSRKLDVIDYVTKVDPNTGVQSFTAENLYNTNEFGIHANYTLNLRDWWRVQLNGTMAYSNNKTINPDFDIANRKGRKADGTIRNSFTLNRANTLFFEIYYAHLFPSTVGMTHWSSYGYMSANLNYFLFDKKLMLSCRFDDVFRQAMNTGTTVYDDFKYTTKINNHVQSGVISVQYKFGSSKVKQVDKKVKETDADRL